MGMTTREKMDKLYKEHLESPYVETPLSRPMFERLYKRLEIVEANAWSAMESEQWALHDYYDHESQKLCARLGY